MESDKIQSDVVAAVRDVSMCFYEPAFVRALTGVSFEVRRSEVFGLLGPKGAGKSAVLRILAGRISPIEGKVRVFGRSPRRAAARVRIGYLPEQLSHDPPLFFVRWLLSLKKVVVWTEEKRIQETEALRLREHRRQSLARALHGQRDLLILDEPFAGLDPAGRRELQEFIAALAGRGKTVVLSSDSLADAQDICGRVAILHEGKIQAIGSLNQ